jgi:plastocyanin
VIRLAALLPILGLGFSSAPATHTVHLDGNAFIPAETRAAPGDTVRFVNGNGGPHNVMFVADSIAKDARTAIDVAMPTPKIGEMSSHLLLDPAESYTIVVPKLNAGRYAFVCLPHQANMRGALIVAP